MFSNIRLYYSVIDAIKFVLINIEHIEMEKFYDYIVSNYNLDIHYPYIKI